MAKWLPRLVVLGMALTSGCYESFTLSCDAGARDPGGGSDCAHYTDDAGVVRQLMRGAEGERTVVREREQPAVYFVDPRSVDDAPDVRVSRHERRVAGEHGHAPRTSLV